jgi:chitinase
MIKFFHVLLLLCFTSCAYPSSGHPKSATEKPLLAGYWHNWKDGATGYLPLREIPEGVTRVIIGFAFPVKADSGEMQFVPTREEPEVIKQDIRGLQEKGIEVFISIGGANHPIELTNPEMKAAFVKSMSAMIRDYGFDGVDIDLEGSSTVLDEGDTDFKNPTTPKIIHFIEAMRELKQEFGDKMLLSAAPETQYVTAGYHAYGKEFGGYLPILHALREELDVVHLQLYNSGSQFVFDPKTGREKVVEQGTVDFAVGLTEMLISGFPVQRDPDNRFPGLGADKVALGLPATLKAAGGGYLTPKKTRQAIKHVQAKYPEMRGVMFWSLNWDRTSEYEFSRNAAKLLQTAE